jgi:hypothetical protein
MTTLFRSSRRAEEFAARVDGATTVRAAGDGATERLVVLTQQLRARGAADAAATPRDAFTADLRERLMAEAAVVLTPSAAGLTLPLRSRGNRERRLVAVAAATVLLGGTAGMATAAQSALPGEALYPIKRGIEKAEVGLSTSSAGRGRDLLQQASGRLGEAQGLIDAGSPTGTPQVPHTLQSFISQAQQGSDLMMGSYAEDRDPASVATVRQFAASALQQVEAMDSTAPPDAQDDLRDAALALRDIDAAATRACDTCSDLPVLSVPKVFLVSAEVERAMRRFEAARPDNSHPVVAAKQDVRRASAAARTSASQEPSGRRSAGEVSGTSGDAVAVPSLPAAPSAPAPSARTTVPPLPKVSIPAAPIPEVSVSTDLDVGKLTDGLGDAVETILPDPDAGGLLP